MGMLRNPRHEAVARAIAHDNTDPFVAYAAAGFKKPRRGNATRLVNSPEMQARIQELARRKCEHAAELAGVDLARVVHELAILGLANMDDYTTVDDRGHRVLNLASLTRAQLAAIQELTPTKFGLKIKLHDKRGALKDLYEHFRPAKDDAAAAAAIAAAAAGGAAGAAAGRDMNEYEIARRVAHLLNRAAAQPSQPQG